MEGPGRQEPLDVQESTCHKYTADNRSSLRGLQPPKITTTGVVEGVLVVEKVVVVVVDAVEEGTDEQEVGGGCTTKEACLHNSPL